MRLITTLLALSCLGSTAVAADPPAAAPLIQVAILLDDSGSMDGLINQARAHLWDVVNQLVATNRDGVRPKLQVALYHYGDTPFLAQPLLPLSDDLDAVSQQLFAIHGGGGTECCGQVIHNAVGQLAWSTRRDDLKLIFIAGNEPFTQGDYDYRKACAEAIGKGIQVNTIHCGSPQDGVAGSWDAAARLADGSYACINQDKIAPQIAAPQDTALAALNQRLNATYLAFGGQREEMQARQVAQDSNAVAAAPAASASRIASKAGGAYRNSSWDLVDAVDEKKVDLAKVAKEELPPELRGLDAGQLATAVATKAAERKTVQAEIAKLAAERNVFIAAEERKQAALTGDKTLGEAMRATIAEQAGKKGFH